MIAVLTGCTTPPVKQTVPFNEASFARFERPGTATISGEAFLRKRNGELALGAGRTVYLMPATGYTEERGKIMFEMKEPEPADPRLAKYVRSTRADSQGRFTFTRLPMGMYILYCKITWTLPAVKRGWQHL